LHVIKNDIHYTDLQTVIALLYHHHDNEGNIEMLWKQWETVFSVDRITKLFFEDYKNVFFSLKESIITKQNIGVKDAHEFTLQFLNRLIFLYFVSKKRGWLNTEKFVRWLWESYENDPTRVENTFYSNWLVPIYFGVFGDGLNSSISLPNHVMEKISSVSFFGVNLFSKSRLDNLGIEISDAQFLKTFEFLENYRFTIKESSPHEGEIAVDPQIIGFVHESLANVSEEIYDRKELGIFYTPKFEVDFMCRRVIVEYLSNNIPSIPKETFYRFLFDSTESRSENLRSMTRKEFELIEYWLDNLAVIDPACGSGAFLVGLLNVLSELYRFIYKMLKREYNNFELKKRIVQHSIYGVDIMPWAVRAAELRIWLQLIVETEFEDIDLIKNHKLPDLNLNLRVGDSLVQKIGGYVFNLRQLNLKPTLTAKLNELKLKKRLYFDSNRNNNLSDISLDEIKEKETEIFKEIVRDAAVTVRDEIIQIKTKIRKEKSQRNLFNQPIFNKEKVAVLENELMEKVKVADQLNESVNNFDKNNNQQRPFIWEIDFAEIFGEKDGFDIVIGNPPYVRQESIAPFDKLKSEVTTQMAREYKEKLSQSVIKQFPTLSGIDKRSDYYVYFYFHGLSLLNRNGAFCFITSNSWLDVDFGTELQEFLSKFVPIRAIYDNVSRSFEYASVNTVIAVLGSPQFESKKTFADNLKVDQITETITMKDNVAKFVMFKDSYESVINAKNLIEIENVSLKGTERSDSIHNIVSTTDYRVFSIRQLDLLLDGIEVSQRGVKNDRNNKLNGKYIGNKWGGKFLRAPPIYFTLISKGKGKLKKLGDCVNVRAGFRTGANDFFYVDTDDNKWNIESEFLRPIIKSPKEIESITIKTSELKQNVFICNKTKDELKGTNALKYIEWGENEKIEIKQGTKKGEKKIGYHNTTTNNSKDRWYSLTENSGANVFIQMTFDRSFPCFYSPIKLMSDSRLFQIEPYKLSDIDLCLSLNCTMTVLFIELFGNSNLGGGGLDFSSNGIKEIMFLPIKSENKALLDTTPKPIFEELGIDPDIPIRDQTPTPAPLRKEIDDLVFKELGLTQNEVNELYWSILELVQHRLSKRDSLG
jgi:hypothetical protein